MIVSPDKEGRVDPVVHDILKGVHSPIPIVPITRLENFKLNPELKKLNKYIICDFIEYDWNWDMETTHLFGRNTIEFKDKFHGDEWKRFDEFVSNNPPILYLKRELLKKDVSDIVKPLQYPSWLPVPEPVSKTIFDSRPLQANFCWGLSHEGRKRVHAEIWLRAGKHGYSVCDNITNVLKFIQEESNPKLWLTVNTPHYARHSIEIIDKINELSKISISLAGAGRVCFRMSESPRNSVMYMWEDEIAYSHPWVSGENCIRSKEGTEIEAIIEGLNNPDLYEIYKAGVDNCKNYWLPNYVKHIEQTINVATK